MPCFSTSFENVRLTADWTDWSTGTTGRPSPHFSACLRKIVLSTERGIWLPFTLGWTITRKAAAAEASRPGPQISPAARTTRRRHARRKGEPPWADERAPAGSLRRKDDTSKRARGRQRQSPEPPEFVVAVAPSGQ